ncbi:MAG: glycosyltransferase family 4 protein [Myxacorys californica WJT36-NPBG1]|jgi:glycosyltransferase involved in cell wall biosynthesis|nr:glycosyltransferase family 4 protein [Myxacorys californica WJT36-NPBG1]
MNRIALVVQRCHESIVGGSEALAWQWATLLKDHYQIDLLTTTALDYVEWKNVLPVGREIREGICIHRFPVTLIRSTYWHELHARLLREFEKHRWVGNDTPSADPSRERILWSVALQEEFIRHQGPFCKDLYAFLNQHWQDYQAIIFFTYLYPTTYFGVPQVPPSKVFIAPTLHDEPVAYLSAYKYMVQRVRSLLWLTNAEREVGRQLWGELPGELVSMAIDTEPRSPYQAQYPYLLYSGRIDPSKGCQELIDFFIQFKKEHPSNVRLVLTGKDYMRIPKHQDIDFRGFVSSEEKFKLMAGAALFVMPSPYESFSIVALEAMAQGTPILANGVCQVLVEHVTHSGGGKIYSDYQSFANSIQELLSDQPQSEDMSRLAQKYVFSNFTSESVQQRLIEALNNASN